MEINYQIIMYAHSGTSEQEIQTAKEMYEQGVREGKYQLCEKVGIIFTDINYEIKAEFIDIDLFVSMGEEVINEY